MGRIKLIKMILLPKIFYILWHSPIYLPLRYFKSLEAILNTFVWCSSRHKLSWHMLINLTDLGGAALLNYNLYYIAAQLSHLFHIDKTDTLRFSTLLCPKWAQLSSDPFSATTWSTRDCLARGPNIPSISI